MASVWQWLSRRWQLCNQHCTFFILLVGDTLLVASSGQQSEHRRDVACLLQPVPELAGGGIGEIRRFTHWADAQLDLSEARAQVWRPVKLGEGDSERFSLVGESEVFLEKQTSIYVKSGDYVGWRLPQRVLNNFVISDDSLDFLPDVLCSYERYPCNDRGTCVFQPTKLNRDPSLLMDLTPWYRSMSEEALRRYRRPSDFSLLSLCILLEPFEINDFYHMLIDRREDLSLNWRSLTVMMKLDGEIRYEHESETEEILAFCWNRLRFITGAFIGVSLLDVQPEQIFSLLSFAGRFLKLVESSPILVLVPQGLGALAYEVLSVSTSDRVLVLESNQQNETIAGVPKASIRNLTQLSVPVIRGEPSKQALTLISHHVDTMLSDGPSTWSVFVVDLVPADKFPAGALYLWLNLLDTVQSGANETAVLRSVREVLRMTGVPAWLDLSADVDASVSYGHLMWMRQQRLTEESGVYMDKVRLRHETSLALAAQVPMVPNIHASSSSPEVLEKIRGLQDYVVKVSHMARTEYVFVVVNGSLIIGNVSGAEGGSLEERIQHKVREGFAQSGPQAAICGPKNHAALRPGVVVEELVLERLPDWDKQWVVEVRVHVVWGTAVVVEFAFGKSGAVLFSRWPQSELADDPESDGGTWNVEGLHLGSAKYPAGSYDFVGRCTRIAVKRAELFARGLDHIRVDFLSRAHCSELFLSEVAFCPAVEFNPDTERMIANAWIYGYGVDP